MSLSVSIKRNTAIDRLIERKCYTCNTLQPPYVFHCPVCRRCVACMDHHCPWVNNCVGYFNQKAFVLFCGYGTVTLCYGSVLMTKLYNAQLYGVDQLTIINQMTAAVAFTLTLSWLGFLFILAVFCDQIVVILNRLTILEKIRIDANRLRGGRVKKRGKENFQTTFGTKTFSLKCLLPILAERTLTVEELYQ